MTTPCQHSTTQIKISWSIWCLIIRLCLRLGRSSLGFWLWLLLLLAILRRCLCLRLCLCLGLRLGSLRGLGLLCRRRCLRLLGLCWLAALPIILSKITTLWLDSDKIDQDSNERVNWGNQRPLTCPFCSHQSCQSCESWVIWRFFPTNEIHATSRDPTKVLDLSPLVLFLVCGHQLCVRDCRSCRWVYALVRHAAAVTVEGRRNESEWLLHASWKSTRAVIADPVKTTRRLCFFHELVGDNTRWSSKIPWYTTK